MVKDHKSIVQPVENIQNLVSKIVELMGQIVQYAISVQKDGDESYEALKRRIDDSKYITAEDKDKKKEFDTIFMAQVKCMTSLHFICNYLIEQEGLPSLLPFFKNLEEFILQSHLQTENPIIKRSVSSWILKALKAATLQ